jgi:hypothetical protein
MVDEGLINVNQAIVNQTSLRNPHGTLVEDTSNSLYTNNKGKVVRKSRSQKSSILTSHYTNKIFSVFHHFISIYILPNAVCCEEYALVYNEPRNSRSEY